jgi:hypothetical protein
MWIEFGPDDDGRPTRPGRFVRAPEGEELAVLAGTILALDEECRTGDEPAEDRGGFVPLPL